MASDLLREEVILSMANAPSPRVLEIRGVCYDTGIEYPGGSPSRAGLMPDKMRVELGRAAEIGFNAVRIYGSSVATIKAAAEVAIDLGLGVWISPRNVDVQIPDVPALILEYAKMAEQLRARSSNVVFVMAAEASLDFRFSTDDPVYLYRANLFFNPLNMAMNRLGVGRWRKFSRFMRETAKAVREVFGGVLTYSAGHWERIDWSLFDYICINYYEAKKDPALFRKRLHRWRSFGKPVIITEFGCCCYEGAEEAGPMGYNIINYDTDPFHVMFPLERDESIQQRYIFDTLKILEAEKIQGAFIFELINEFYVHYPDPHFDLDLASFGLLKTLPRPDQNSPRPSPENKLACATLTEYFARLDAQR